jgi:hypothetical protein
MALVHEYDQVRCTGTVEKLSHDSKIIIAQGSMHLPSNWILHKINRRDGHKEHRTSPAGKTPASTLYAATSWSIKDEGKASAFRKTERGKFEAKILTTG